jgi:leukotriene-A4 hydrolase
VTSGAFRDCFVAFFAERCGALGVGSDEFWERALHSPGLHADIANDDFANSLSVEAIALAQSCVKGLATPAAVLSTWSTQQVCIFLETLIAIGKDASISEATIESLNEAYSFTSSGNSEIRFRWQSLCLQSKVDSIVPHVVAFITQQGRMKFVRPLYRALFAMDASTAVRTFKAHADSYHPIARRMIEADLLLTA